MHRASIHGTLRSISSTTIALRRSQYALFLSLDQSSICAARCLLTYWIVYWIMRKTKEEISNRFSAWCSSASLVHVSLRLSVVSCHCSSDDVAGAMSRTHTRTRTCTCTRTHTQHKHKHKAHAHEYMRTRMRMDTSSCFQIKTDLCVTWMRSKCYLPLCQSL